MTTIETQPVIEDPSEAEHDWRRWDGPFSALYQDALDVHFRHEQICWEAVASPMAKDHIVKFVDGWGYVRGPDYDEAAVKRLERHQAEAARFPSFGEWYANVIRAEVVEIIERLRKHPKPTRPHEELIAHLEECIEAQGHIMGDLHWRMAASRIGKEKPTFTWPPIYNEITGRPEAEAPVLLGGLTNEMTRTVKQLRRLARIVAGDAGLMEAVEAGDLEAIEAGDGESFRRFRSGFRSLLRRYGHRTGAGWGSKASFGSPTWNVRPRIPLQMIATYARSDLDEVERKEREVAKARKRLGREVRKQLSSDPELLARFEEELANASMFAYFLEDHNDWMDQSAPGILRDAAHVVGLRLVRDGVLDDPEDVVHLRLAELRNPPQDARTIVAERRAEFERQQELDPPEHIGPGNVPPPPVLHDEGDGRVGNVLHGIAASSGRYTGRARVFPPSPILPDLEEGDILVAEDAGPDWTPIFAILGAVVLDKGAAWQHAAVVAREFGIAAVTGTKDGTSAIADGQIITVDGDAGIVELG